MVLGTAETNLTKQLFVISTNRFILIIFHPNFFCKIYVCAFQMRFFYVASIHFRLQQNSLDSNTFLLLKNNAVYNNNINTTINMTQNINTKTCKTKQNITFM